MTLEVVRGGKQGEGDFRKKHCGACVYFHDVPGEFTRHIDPPKGQAFVVSARSPDETREKLLIRDTRGKVWRFTLTPFPEGG